MLTLLLNFYLDRIHRIKEIYLPMATHPWAEGPSIQIILSILSYIFLFNLESVLPIFLCMYLRILVPDPQNQS